MVSPGMVYISYPTEYGTIYSKKELETIYQICNKYKLPLYIDGARLGFLLLDSTSIPHFCIMLIFPSSRFTSKISIKQSPLLFYQLYPFAVIFSFLSYIYCMGLVTST